MFPLHMDTEAEVLTVNKEGEIARKPVKELLISTIWLSLFASSLLFSFGNMVVSNFSIMGSDCKSWYFSESWAGPVIHILLVAILLLC